MLTSAGVTAPLVLYFLVIFKLISQRLKLRHRLCDDLAQFRFLDCFGKPYDCVVLVNLTLELHDYLSRVFREK